MKKIVWVFACVFILIPFVSNSQLVIIIRELPANTPSNSVIYLAGNINSWNPKNDEFKFNFNQNTELELQLDSLTVNENIEFKLTLGSWQLTETDEEGGDIANRNYSYIQSDTLYVQVKGWKDSEKERLKSSLSYNVEIIDNEFYMPQLDRFRRIWIYLPPDYDLEIDKDYPLLYMHDGQNLFDNQTAYAGEWNVDEHLNYLFEEGYSVPIVIGIDNGGAFRNNEYTLQDNADYEIVSEGDKYLAFIVETLHPYIMSHYRCENNREEIGIMGSSLGGLISAYALINYPEVFGLGAMFSPAYWINPKIFTSEFSSDLGFRIMQIAGSQESHSMESDVLVMDSLFTRNLENANLKYEIIEEGKHNELFWSNEFQKAIKYLYSPE